MSFTDETNSVYEFRIREACTDNSEDASNDAIILSALIQELADFHKKPDEPKVGADQLQQYLKNGAAKALIATAKTKGARNLENCEKLAAETVAAYAIYYECPSIEFGKVFFLNDLYIRPPFRRQKFGSKLMQTFIKISRELRCDSLIWTVRSFNISAIRFYESIGAKELTAQSADGRSKMKCWAIKSDEFDGIANKLKDCLSDIEFNVLNDVQLKEQADQLTEQWFQMDDTDKFRRKVPFSNALRTHKFEAVQAQNCSDCAVLGLALFHRCAFATWSGTFLSVDCLKVRSGCRRRGIGRTLAVEMIRIAAKSASPLIGWVAKEDEDTDAFFQSIGAINLSDKESFSLFILNGSEESQKKLIN
ncbi:hypothetical protein niasHT_038173 [Heterodera trifolii]|uniref:N-acetyltransferase domain-containing protein n=1 Tax=Heterodera trifolii TaxID=157864 RepID=A0ABD2IBU5_9BILA